MFVRELEERMQIIASNTRCRVFSASYNPRYYYPYRLAKASKAWDGLRDSCYELMIDSAFNDPTVTNEDVLEATKQLNGDYIYPKDYPGDADATIDSLREFLELYNARDDINGRVIPILQPPHIDHYREHEGFYEQFSHLAIGGLHPYDPAEQVTIIKQLRDTVGPHTYLHGFGIGTSLPLIKAMRRYAPLLDSIDMSTAERAVRNGQLPDAALNQHDGFRTPYGEDSTTIRAQFASAVLTSVNYLLSEKVNEEKLDDTYHEETELPVIDDVIRNTDIRSRHDLTYPGDDTTPGAADGSRATTLNSF